MGRDVVRFAHMSDMHVEPDVAGAPPRRSAEGLRGAIAAIDALDPRPDFVITGGDHIMDALERGEADVHRQWALYKSVMAEHCRHKVYPIIGNHDVFGWMTDAVAPETPGYGKGLACKMLGLPKSYYSFDATSESGEGHWHIICLDNTQPSQRGYYGGLDPTQYAWLQKDLAAVPPGRPICVVSHIPIVSICAQHFFSPDQRVDFWKIYDVFVHHDARELVELLAKHNVKLCVASHIHMLDRIEFRGVTFICDGAVSGDWWRGPFRGFKEGYGVFDLFPDGSFKHEYHELGWDAKAGQKPPAVVAATR